MEAEKEKAPGLKTGPAPGPVSENPLGGDADGPAGGGTGSGPADDGGLAGDATAPSGAAGAAGGRVSGPGGLPEGNPDELRADPSEGDQDPSTSTGRG
jgi:hypothetical protein